MGIVVVVGLAVGCGPRIRRPAQVVVRPDCSVQAALSRASWTENWALGGGWMQSNHFSRRGISLYVDGQPVDAVEGLQRANVPAALQIQEDELSETSLGHALYHPMMYGGGTFLGASVVALTLAVLLPLPDTDAGDSAQTAMLIGGAGALVLGSVGALVGLFSRSSYNQHEADSVIISNQEVARPLIGALAPPCLEQSPAPRR